MKPYADLHVKYRAWFDEYAMSFKTGDTQLEDALQLKYEHTLRVCKEMDALCSAEGVLLKTAGLAFFAALFHDVARFEQFRVYRTFADRKSENHAHMSVDIIEKCELLSELDDTDRKTVIEAIRYHNAIEVPGELTDAQAFMCRLLRDADKLDIYKIALDHYVNPAEIRKETVQVGIPDGVSVSKDVCDLVMARKIVPYEMIKTVADFKMIQIGWVFDLNFLHSLECVKMRKYIDDIVSHLPDCDYVQQTAAYVKQYMENKIEIGRTNK